VQELKQVALAFGGQLPATTAVTESWNGTSWTEVADLNIALRNPGGTGASNTAALQYGGGPTKTTATSIWNGTTWINDQDLNVAREDMGSAGANNSSALAFAAVAAETEEWYGDGKLTDTFTTS
jgi:hypothetical protein